MPLNIQNAYLEELRDARVNLLLLIYILLNTLKDSITIHLQLI